MGCLSRVGRLVVLAVAGAGAYWMYGDRLPSEVVRASKRASQGVTARVRSADSSRRARSESEERSVGWVPLDRAPDDTRSNAAREKLAGLAKRTGPAFANFDANEIADVLSPALMRMLPRTASESAVAIVGDELKLRSVVELRDFGGSSALGTLLGGALGGRDTLRVSGTLDSPASGVAQFRVRQLQLKGISIPSALIPSIVRLLREHSGSLDAGRTVHVDSLPPDALLVKLPPSVADVRVHNNRITLYRAAP